MSATLTYIRTNLSRLLVIIGVLSALGSFYFTSPEVGAVFKEISLWNINILTFTLFVGLITLGRRYVTDIMNFRDDWPLKLYGMVLIVIWVIMGVYYGMYSDTYQVAYLSTKITLHIAILGQLIIFMVSGAYRSFRMKTMHTAVLTIGAIIILICNAPWLSTPFPVVDKITYWLLNNPQMAASRTMVICAGIGGVILGIRVLLGHEKGALRITEAE